MLRIWGKLYKNGRMVKSFVAENAMSSLADRLRIDDCIDQIVREFDLPRPMWLGESERTFAEFHAVEFRQEHFFENFPYAKLEIEVIENDEKPFV